MKWKVKILGTEPSRETVRLLSLRTGLDPVEILGKFAGGRGFVCGGLTEAEAQELADGIKRDRGLTCRVLPDDSPGLGPPQLYRVILVNYKPGYRTRLRRKLQELTRLPQDHVVGWLSRMPFALSRRVNLETARKVESLVAGAGGIVRIEMEAAIPGAVTPRRKSGAVFAADSSRKRRVTRVSAVSSTGGKPEKTAAGPTVDEPPVVEFPDGYMTGPPPRDRMETEDGVLFFQPPLRFTPGVPEIRLPEGMAGKPPVLAPEEVPGVRESSRSPSPMPGDESLTPPVLDDSESGSGKDGGIPDGFLGLFLCKPGRDSENNVARALKEVLGMSRLEAMETVKKAPVMLREYDDHTDAVLAAHQLESRGVTVSLDRRLPPRGLRRGGGEDLKAWLARNG